MPIGTSTAIALGTTALGALSGGRDKTSTQTTRPYLPKEFEEGYKRLLADAMKTYETPFRPVERRRAAVAPSQSFGGLFFNPEMAEIQAQSDRKFMGGMAPMAPPSNQAAEAEQMAKMQAQMQAQDYLSRQRSSYAPGTDMQRMHNQPMNMEALGEALADYEKRFNYANPSLDNLLKLTSPELRSRIYG